MEDKVMTANLKALSARYPQLAEKVRTIEPAAYHLVPSADPLIPNLVYAIASEQPIMFYDPAGPLEQTHGFLTSVKLGKAQLVVLLGLGLGYQLLHLAKVLQAQTPLRKLIVVERDLACFRRALEVCDLRPFFTSPLVELIIGVPEEGLYLAVREAVKSDLIRMKALKFLPWPASLRVASTYYQRVRQAFADVATTWLASLGNDPFDSLVAYEHFLRNSQEVLGSPLLHEVKGLFPGRPAVVVSAGPSLSKNVHLLKLVESQAVILALDASWKVLEKQGIVPHFVVSVERTPGTFRFIEGLETSRKTVYAMISFIFPETLARYRGPRLFLHRAYSFYKLLGMEEDSLVMGNSTAHMAFQLAAAMGCNPIILIGQDLAFGDSGLTHATGCVHGQKQIFFHEEPSLEVPGNLVPTVRTSTTWYKFLKQYEEHIAEYPGRAINATEGGARIAGTEVMPFLEAIRQHCREEFAPREVILERLARSQGASQASFVEGLTRLETVLAQTLDCCRQGLSALEGPLTVALDLARQGTKRLPASLRSRITAALGTVSAMADLLVVEPGYTVKLSEYLLQPCGAPFVCEWQVVGERFRDEGWADAYRLKIAREFFATTGQLCRSLQQTLAGTKPHLGEPAAA